MEMAIWFGPDAARQLLMGPGTLAGDDLSYRSPSTLGYSRFRPVYCHAGSSRSRIMFANTLKTTGGDLRIHAADPR